MDFDKNVHSEDIEKLTRLLARRNRSRSFDLKNTEDIIEATVKATIEYVNMCDCWFRLIALREDFDKSLECCEPSVWIRTNTTGETETEDIEDVRFNFEGASESLHSIMCSSEQKCITLWKVVLKSSKDEVKKYFLGEVIDVEEDVLDDVLENNMFNLINTMEFDGVVEHSVENFSKELKKVLLKHSENNSEKKASAEKSTKVCARDGAVIDLCEYR